MCFCDENGDFEANCKGKGVFQDGRGLPFERVKRYI